MSAKHNLYPHMIVGNIQKVSNNTISNNVICYTLAPTQFISALIDLKESTSQLDDFVSAANTFLAQNENSINKKSELLAIFPQYDIFVEAINSSNSNYFANIDNNLFGFIAQENVMWENSIAHYILNDKGKVSITNDLICSLKIIETLKRIQNDSLNTHQKIFNFWKDSRIVFPSSIFPLPKKSIEIPEVPEHQQAVDINELRDKRDAYIKAKKDIMSAFKMQNEALYDNKISKEDFIRFAHQSIDEDKAKENNIKNAVEVDLDKEYEIYLNQPYFYKLDKNQSEKLAKETVETLQLLNVDANNINVVCALSALDENIDSCSKDIAQTIKPNKLVKVGTTLIEVNNSVYEDVLCREQESLTHCELIRNLISKTPDKNYVQILGMGNYNIIEQELVRYEADEIAHIETVLKGESKERTNRELTHNEEFYSSETEVSEESETEIKTSDRFEVSKEVSSIVSQSSQFQAGVSISAGYGPVSLSASVGYASSKSNTDSATTATNNAREVIEKATERIQKKVSERRSVTTISEVETINQHKIDNVEGADHINGFYYWVDKVYKNQIINIGKRLMLEFLIPEPAAYHIFSNAFSKKEGVTIDIPVNPKIYADENISEPLISFGNITRDNYKYWAAIYNVIDIPNPPTEFIHISKAYSLDYTPGGKQWQDKDFNDLAVPEGYEAKLAKISLAFSTGSGRYMHGYIGNKYYRADYSTVIEVGLDNIVTDIVPFTIRGHVDEYVVNVGIECQLSDNGYAKWQKDAYAAIINAYNTQKAEYDNKISNLEASVVISGNDPAENRRIEKTELKKWAIELLTLQRFEGFNAMHRAIDGYPEIDFAEALNEGTFVKFFEQAIEWENMTYIFYPYFWTKIERWSTIRQLGDTDYCFSEFLKAGYARVVVPVSPKFTEAILHYLNSGEIWMGESLPAIDDELYMSIVDEISRSENNTDGEPVGEPWETRVPTNLVMLTSRIPANLPGSNEIDE